MQHQPHHLHHHTRPRAPSSHHRLALKRRQHDAHVVVTVVVEDPSIRIEREREEKETFTKPSTRQRFIVDSTNDRRVVRRPIASTRPLTRPNARAIRMRRGTARVHWRSETETRLGSSNRGGNRAWIGNPPLERRVEGEERENPGWEKRVLVNSQGMASAHYCPSNTPPLKKAALENSNNARAGTNCPFSWIFVDP